jgi:hypothetical protein
MEASFASINSEGWSEPAIGSIVNSTSTPSLSIFCAPRATLLTGAATVAAVAGVCAVVAGEAAGFSCAERGETATAAAEKRNNIGSKNFRVFFIIKLDCAGERESIEFAARLPHAIAGGRAPLEFRRA